MEALLCKAIQSHIEYHINSNTYNHHACRTECDAMTEHYYRLRDYELNHAECNAIMHIID